MLVTDEFMPLSSPSRSCCTPSSSPFPLENASRTVLPHAGEHKGDEDQEKEAVLGLHFIKLRPEPVTGDNIRRLVQVGKSVRAQARARLFRLVLEAMSSTRT